MYCGDEEDNGLSRRETGSQNPIRYFEYVLTALEWLSGHAYFRLAPPFFAQPSKTRI
jgi:hypothetical protein